MPALDVNRRRNVVHQFAGIAPISLQEKRLLVTAATLADRVIKDSFGPVVHKIDLLITAQRLRKLAIVRWHVAVSITTDRIDQPVVLG